MSPAPSRKHQEISGFFFRKIGNYLEDKKCSVYAAPFDVRLPKMENNEAEIDTVVQPDISVFCDEKKLDDRGALGAPDFIIEIISPNTASKDLKDKLYLYERVKVKEYWVADPINKTLMVFKLDKKGQYKRAEIYAGEDNVEVGIFKALTIELKDVFKG